MSCFLRTIWGITVDATPEFASGSIRWRWLFSSSLYCHTSPPQNHARHCPFILPILFGIFHFLGSWMSLPIKWSLKSQTLGLDQHEDTFLSSFWAGPARKASQCVVLESIEGYPPLPTPFPSVKRYRVHCPANVVYTEFK